MYNKAKKEHQRHTHSATDLELPSGQKNPAGQGPEHRKLDSVEEEPNRPPGHGRLTPFEQ